MNRAERLKRDYFHEKYLGRHYQILTVIRLFEAGLLPTVFWNHFLKWEKEHVTGNGDYGSDDWPGWVEFGVDEKPVPPLRNPRR